VTNTTTLSAATLILDTDPILLDSLSEDTSECFTQVTLRGAADVQPYYASLLETTLVDPNTGANETAWNIYKFLYPPNAFSTGTISAQTSTTVTISSDSATESWGVNYWNGIQAQIAVINPAITGIADLTGAEWKTITSNTALGAGGSSTITVDSPFSNTGYTRYAIRGQPAGSSDVYRKYTFKNRYVAQHLVKKFQHSVPWSPSQGALQQTLFPQAVICSIPSLASSTVQWPLDFEVIPYDGTTDGYIRFYEPVVDVVGGNGGQVGQPLIAGGSAVTKPADIIVVVPYSRGALSAVQPLSGGTPTYSGTAYTRFGIQRTLNRDYPDWLDRGNLPAMQTLANEILATVSNVVQEGSITYLGKYGTALVGGSWPFAVNIAKAGGTTTFESMAAPVRTAVLEWPQEGAVPWITRLQFSTKRQQYSGDRLYMHPMYNYQGGIFGGVTEVMAVGAPLAGFEAAGLPGAMGGYGGETGRAPLPNGQPFQPGAMGGPLGFSPVNAPGFGGANLPGFGTVGTADLDRGGLPAGFAGYEVAGTIAPDVGNPWAQARQAFAGLNASVGLGPGTRATVPRLPRELPVQLPPPLQDRPIPLPRPLRLRDEDTD
jgi:hypothetical protein